MKQTTFFSIALFMLIFQGVSAQDTYLQCGTIMDVETGKFLKEKTIVVSENKIKSIVDGYVQGEVADQVINLKTKTVMPGFIDMHVHIESESSPTTYIDRYTKNDVDVAFQSTVYAKKTLMAGFTTVRDLGGSGVNIALRKAIDNGLVVGPRIFTAGEAIATTGGHADPTNGMKWDQMGDPGPKEGVVNSPEEGKKAVRQRYKEGADVIKITATGGVLSVAKSGQNPQFMIDEIKAITDTAKDYGMLTAAHAHGDEGMQRAILGGIKTIEHGTLMSEETMELMKKYDTYLVPTITAGKEVTENAKKPGYFPPVVAKKASEIGPKIQAMFAKAYKRGVPIAFGTDAGVFNHGENAREFVYMVEAGMPVTKAIYAATVTNATLLGKATELGQLKEGFIADIVATDKNPIDQVETLKSVSFVMKNGKVYKN
ncbi:metal-dependent hydrolase family protein [Croceivirga sp. JEA036]|uniref:metal-dependent hydrolase family protein n=1 Tax=Croceivirga sp. JEA036 TaxID=2721162 RepID=UPI001439980D|nr:amidohydrolase family protein [Croceivirga sp. JEA036]NJB36287.1 amidohydrolase family protein [Croceivirga sp. JEA036]